MKTIFFLFMMCLASTAATAETLFGIQIIKMYAQSRLDIDAHLVQINQPLASACNANRIYVDFADKELFASAFTAYLAGRTVDVIYSTNASPKTAYGHSSGITCRLISIF